MPSTSFQFLLIVYVLINLYAFLAVAYDKRKAIRSHSHKRTPEGFLFFLAAAFGAIGVYLAMHLFRHKTRKWYFHFGISLLVLQNFATLYLISQLVAT